ncbi:MAG: type II secretion system protein [Candidatus Omnitrophota bacterium]
MAKSLVRKKINSNNILSCLRSPKGDLSLTGFTLIELVIVLALFAILFSFAVAKFVDLGKKAIEVNEDQTIAALRTAVLLYRARYDSWPDRNLFTLLDSAPPYIEPVCLGCCPRDGKQWCLFQFDFGGLPEPDPWTIECPHYKRKYWKYYGPGTGVWGEAPEGSIKSFPLAAGH